MAENQKKLPNQAEYSIFFVCDSYVVIVDALAPRSITNDASSVVERVNVELRHGLGHRKLYYRDSANHFDELGHDQGVFTSFAPCSESQQNFFINLIASKA